MIRTWAANIKPLLEESCYRTYYLQVPKFRQQKADALKQQQKKAQSIGAWIVYMRMKEFYGFTEDAVHNLSHSGDYVLCSVCTDEPEGVQGSPQVRVGCDVEEIRKGNLKLAKHFFCESEIQVLVEERDEEKQKTLFYRFWVLKESFMKATRKGMGLALHAFEIRLGEPSVLVKQPDTFPEVYHYMEGTLGDGAYRVAVCSTDPKMDLSIRELPLGSDC